MERMESTTYMVTVTWAWDEDHTDVGTFTIDRPAGAEALSHEEILHDKKGLLVRRMAYKLLKTLDSGTRGAVFYNRLYEVGRGMVVSDRSLVKSQLFPASLTQIGYFHGRRLMEVSRE